MKKQITMSALTLLMAASNLALAEQTKANLDQQTFLSETEMAAEQGSTFMVSKVVMVNDKKAIFTLDTTAEAEKRVKSANNACAGHRPNDYEAVASFNKARFLRLKNSSTSYDGRTVWFKSC